MKYSLLNMAEIPPAMRYDLLFEKLPSLPKDNKNTGRPQFLRNAILRALIYKAIRSIPTITELVYELQCNPSILLICGFELKQAPPSIECFSRFLRTTDNSLLQQLRMKLVTALVAEGVIKGERVALDSCPIVVPAKQNNLKTSVKNRFAKAQVIQADPQAKLGIILRVVQPFVKEPALFWGYRNHVLVEADSELPLMEITQAANVAETASPVSNLTTQVLCSFASRTPVLSLYSPRLILTTSPNCFFCIDISVSFCFCDFLFFDEVFVRCAPAPGVFILNVQDNLLADIVCQDAGHPAVAEERELFLAAFEAGCRDGAVIFQ